MEDLFRGLFRIVSGSSERGSSSGRLMAEKMKRDRLVWEC